MLIRRRKFQSKGLIPAQALAEAEWVEPDLEPHEVGGLRPAKIAFREHEIRAGEVDRVQSAKLGKLGRLEAVNALVLHEEELARREATSIAARQLDGSFAPRSDETTTAHLDEPPPSGGSGRCLAAR